MGKEYHKELIEHIDKLKAIGTISPEDTQLFLFTDSIEDCINLIKEKSITKYGLKTAKTTCKKLLIINQLI